MGQLRRLYGTVKSAAAGTWDGCLGLAFRIKKPKAKYMPDDTVERRCRLWWFTVEHLIEQQHLDGSLLPLTRTIIEAICHDQPMMIPWIQVSMTGISHKRQVIISGNFEH